MRIDGPGPVLPAALLASLAKGARFAAEPEKRAAEVPAAATQAAPNPATSMQMLVALASIDPGQEKRRKQATDASRGLSVLERLRDDLAIGAVSPERLHDLAAWADGFTPPDDPVLADIGREIELRVRVELAKLDMQA
ncbi:flagellar assembly protein FliX [Sphingomonas sp.]|jgi:hypothetical protein|uniref:flagellar assembly protein FliX n=1 Tax=Sphingomonas sp. TaxID=28214 RepID=UPI002EDB602C